MKNRGEPGKNGQRLCNTRTGNSSIREVRKNKKKAKMKPTVRTERRKNKTDGEREIE